MRQLAGQLSAGTAAGRLVQFDVSRAEAPFADVLMDADTPVRKGRDLSAFPLHAEEVVDGLAGSRRRGCPPRLALRIVC